MGEASASPEAFAFLLGSVACNPVAQTHICTLPPQAAWWWSPHQEKSKGDVDQRQVRTTQKLPEQRDACQKLPYDRDKFKYCIIEGTSKKKTKNAPTSQGELPKDAYRTRVKEPWKIAQNKATYGSGSQPRGARKRLLLLGREWPDPGRWSPWLRRQQ